MFYWSTTFLNIAIDLGLDALQAIATSVTGASEIIKAALLVALIVFCGSLMMRRFRGQQGENHYGKIKH